MATRQITRNIALTPQLDRLIEKKLASGGYQSASEVVREGLRLLQQRDAQRGARLDRMREEIELGWQQAEKGDAVDGRQVFEEIRQLSKKRRQAAKRR